MKRKMKGSFTVEAAYVMPFLLLLICIMGSLMLHVYQKCWSAQAACELAIFGSCQSSTEGGNDREKELGKWKVMRSECYIEPVGFAGDVQKDKRKIKVVIKGETFVPGRQGLCFSGECEQKILKPESEIRKLAALSGKGA